VHGRIGRIPLADQFVRLVHADVVLVSVEALVVLLGPARIDVLLCELGGLILPFLGRFAGLDRFVLLFRVALPGCRYDRGKRTLAWISRNGRVARDFERYATTAAAYVRLAMIGIMLRRLAANASKLPGWVLSQRFY
jgi:hypothetical protein